MSKRMIRKILFTLSAMLLVTTLSVGITLAYLTDSESVKNTFTVGKVDIVLNEADVWEAGEKHEVDGNTELIPESMIGAEKKGGTRVKGNSYKLLPGHTYTKDPTVSVSKDSVKSYIRMKVQITDINDVLAVFGNDFLPQNFVGGWQSDVWLSKKIDATSNPGSYIYEFWYKDVVDPAALEAGYQDGYNKLPALFTSFTLPGEGVDGDDIAKLTEMQIIVTAQAIQADGFDNAEAAWEAFDKQVPSTATENTNP